MSPRPGARGRQVHVAAVGPRTRRSRTSSPRCGPRPTPTPGPARAGGAARRRACPASARNLPYGDRRRRPRPGRATGRADVLRGDRVGGAEQEHVGAVGQHHQRDDLPGVAPLERDGEQQRRAGRRRRCRRSPARSSTTAAGSTPSDFVSDRHRPGVGGRRRRRASTSAASTPGGLRGRRPTPPRRAATYCISPKRSSHCFERASPGVRQRSRNSSVADPAPRYSASTRAVVVAADQHGRRRRRRRPPRRPSRAGRCGCRRRPRASVRRRPSARRSAPTAERTAPPASRRGTSAVEAQGGVDRGGVGLVEVGRRRRSRTRATARRCRAPSAAPGGPASTPMRRGVLVVRGDGAGALAAARRRPPPRSSTGRAGGTAGRRRGRGSRACDCAVPTDRI